MDIFYYACRTFFAIIAQLFFKDRCVIGAENIPKKGPVIICANHANQFLDAVMLSTSTPRQVGFIIAAKSYRRNVIGHFAKGIGAIPVERPQDLVKTGKGSIVELKENLIIGSGTKFTEQVKPGDALKIKDIPVDIIVKQVESDTELTYSSDIAFTQQGANLSYKVLPKQDQSGMYSAVWKRLAEGGCVGIFPEGGSHDRTTMLPLKAGICIMALGGMTKTSEPIKIVPCGFNYFKGHQFRSKAIVEFGVPYEIPQKLVETYAVNKREAIATLLEEIEKKMKSVTLTAPSYSELTSIFMARKLYTPAHHHLSIDEEHLLNRILALGYNQLNDKPEVAELFEQIRVYNQDLKKLRLEDSAIKRISSKDWKNFINLIISFVKLLISCTFALPGVLLNGPLGLVIKYLSEKERKKALAGSNVKVRGADVVASHKVLCAIIAFPIACGIWVLAFRLILYFCLGVQGALLNSFTLFFFSIWPFYSYAMILSSDGAVTNYRNLKARFFLLVSKSKIEQLRNTRKELQKKISNFVETNAHYVLGKATSEHNSPAGIDGNDNSTGRSRTNSLEIDDALGQAFATLDETGI